MKNAKRILALVLAVMMLATCMVPVVFADEDVVATETATTGKQNNFSDVNAEAVYVQAVKTLNLMGIINGYPDGTFGPDKNVTRAEFTAMLMRTLNLGGIGGKSSSTLPFTDVDDNDSGINWAIPDINTAYARGIINGYDDQTFKPNANVSFEEAIKMIVATLGYSLDVSGTPWYGAYLSQASKLGIIKVAQELGQVETPATRACIAQMLFDSLEVELVEQNEVTKKTILTDYLGYQKDTGRIASDGVASLMVPDVLLRDNEVQIMSLKPVNGNYQVHTYRTTNPEIKEYLGYEIEYYYKDDGSGIRDLGIFVLQNVNELTIEADMIEASESNNQQIRYYTETSNGRTMVANLDENSLVIYNGKLYGPSGVQSRFNSAMIPQVGQVKLLDANRDNKYDVIYIDSYQVYYVSSKVASEYAIVDDVTKTGEAKKLVLNVNDNSRKTTIVNKSGATMEFNSIGNGNVICLAVSNVANGGSIVQKAVVVNDTVSGSVTSMESGSSVTIGNTKYKYSKAAPWLNGMASVLAEPQIQDSGTFYKDINGDIVAYKKNATVENVYYGYIMGVRNSDSVFDDVKEVRVLNQNGTTVSVMLTAEAKINGAPVGTSENAITILTNTALNQNKDAHNGTATYHQMIKYTTRNTSLGTTFDKIYTANDNVGATVESDKLYVYSAVKADAGMKYNKATKKLTSTAGVTLDVGSATILVVPADRGAYDDYAKRSLTQVFKNETTNYYIEAYDVSKTNSAKVVVCYGYGGSATEADNTTPVYVLSQNVERATNETNGDVMSRLTSFVSGSSTEKQEWLSTASEILPQLGDIYRPGLDKDGFTTIKSENLLYRVGGTNAYGVIFSTDMNSPLGAENTVMVGSIVAIDDTGFSVLPQRVIAGQIGVDLTSATNFNYSEFSNARVIVYDETGAELVIKDSTDEKEGVLRSIVGYDEEGITNPTKVLIHMAYGRIKMVCILDKNA